MKQIPSYWDIYQSLFENLVVFSHTSHDDLTSRPRRDGRDVSWGCPAAEDWPISLLEKCWWNLVSFHVVEVLNWWMYVNVRSPTDAFSGAKPKKRDQVGNYCNGIIWIPSVWLAWLTQCFFPKYHNYAEKNISHMQFQVSRYNVFFVRVRHPLSLWSFGCGGCFLKTIKESEKNRQVPLLLLLAAAGSAFVGWQAGSVHPWTMNSSKSHLWKDQIDKAERLGYQNIFLVAPHIQLTITIWSLLMHPSVNRTQNCVPQRITCFFL